MPTSEPEEPGGRTSMFAKTTEPTPLAARFARIKESLIAGHEDEIKASWTRLLCELRSEVETIAQAGSSIIPTIHFSDLDESTKADGFVQKLRSRGAGVIRQVVPADEAVSWDAATETYLGQEELARRLPTHDPHVYGVYWSPGQIRARAHANVLAAQRFLMRRLWRRDDPGHASLGDEEKAAEYDEDEQAPAATLVSVNHPVVYADRIRRREPRDEACSDGIYVDSGSVERWEPDGYGDTYERIWNGSWEQYDPWQAGPRLRVTSDLYNSDGACSMFRMFQGWLPLSDLPEGQGILRLCPMIRLSTAYLLLRPFFTPRVPLSEIAPSDFLAPGNWALERPASSVIQGALPSYPQELNAALHPHLQLDRSIVPIPRLSPGDYLVWHCDAVYALDRRPCPDLPTITVLHLPACPLTQTNALFLSHQRKAFLYGESNPDFGATTHGEDAPTGSEGVRHVGEAGGVEGMRAMGLLPWDDDDAEDDIERQVIEMANGILFPDKYAL